jgi:SAM-dependent methyltransferase
MMLARPIPPPHPVASTSIHRLNGDRHLSIPGTLAYFVLNAINNGWPAGRPRGLAVRDFTVADVQRYVPRLPAGASPSRKLSDLFWMSLPWARMSAALGPLHVLDVGCGSGSYGARLIDWSGSHVSSYLGVDLQARSEWQVLHAGDERLRFATGDARRLDDHLAPATNLIVSQSAIEHMDNDLDFFAQLRDHAARRERPTLQIHLCPSPACLPLYLRHGVRQYSVRTLSLITRLFPDSRAVIYGLGGRRCNRLHFHTITWPLLTGRSDRRAELGVTYDALAASAIARDMAAPQSSPAFYALVIHSRPGTQVF